MFRKVNIWLNDWNSTDNDTYVEFVHDIMKHYIIIEGLSASSSLKGVELICSHWIWAKWNEFTEQMLN